MDIVGLKKLRDTLDTVEDEVFVDGFSEDGETMNRRWLDADLWWYLLSEDDMNLMDKGGFIRKLMEREGSPGKGLSCLVDTRNTPMCKIDWAPEYLKDMTTLIRTVKNYVKDFRMNCNFDGEEWTIAIIGNDSFTECGPTPEAALFKAFVSYLTCPEWERLNVV